MRKLLSKLVAKFTGHPRYFPEIEWSYLWTHNVFRSFEYIFGRDNRVRCEVTASWEDGKVIYQFHTWEAAIGHFESWVRGLIPRAFPYKLYIPTFQTVSGQMTVSPYLFAVAYDNSAIQSSAGATPTISLTVSGTNRQMLIFTDSGSTDQGTTAFYAGVEATFVNKQTAVNYTYMYQLVAPTTGANNAVGNSSGSDLRLIVGNWTGASQSGSLDASTTHSTSSTASYTPTITTNTDAAMIVVGGQNNGGTATASVGTMRQAAGTGRMMGDRLTVTAGSNSMTMGGVGTANWGSCIASIAPAVVSSPSSSTSSSVSSSSSSSPSTSPSSVFVDFVAKPLRYWDGESWIDVDITGV